MSRSGYTDSYCDDPWQMIRWRGAVASATRGWRGQALLREAIAALDALPAKRLITGDLARDGEVCALGAVGRARGLDLTDLDPEDRDTVANLLDIAPALAAEIAYMNDEYLAQGNYGSVTPEELFARMRGWLAEQIKPA